MRITPRPPPETRTPLTVIGGFLGAGKTTFLNHLLAGAQGRYAVLVNDFGAVDVDGRLVVDHDGKTMRLANGCVCCSLADGFTDTLLRVLAEEPPFDHVVIEASGVGDPWAIAEIALVEPGLALDGVVVLADAERVGAMLRDDRIGDTVARQLRAADIVLLNKADLVDAAGRDAARAAVAAVKPGVRFVETVQAFLPDAVIGLGGKRRERATRMRAEAVDHEGVFRRVSYVRDGRFDPARLPDALARLPASLLRLKGMCRVTGRPGPQLLQMVGPRWSLEAAPSGPEGNAAVELVGIGLDGRLDAVPRILDDALDDDHDGPREAAGARAAQEENAACP